MPGISSAHIVEDQLTTKAPEFLRKEECILTEWHTIGCPLGVITSIIPIFSPPGGYNLLSGID
jgi:hypothetical protein